MKIDIEGFEFKAISSVISTWLTKNPPCYFFMEFWKQYSHISLIETLLSVVGYDAIWRPAHNEYPNNTEPWLKDLKGTERELKTIVNAHNYKYAELIFGFSDVDKCIINLMRKD